MNNNEIFTGVFNFTNASDEDFVALWNNQEYIFPAQSTCPLVIPKETLEGIQEIRKKFALKFAQREFFKSQNYFNLEKKASGYRLPAMYDEKLLEPYIEQCLTPLPAKIAGVVNVPKKELKTKASAAIGDASLNHLVSADGPFKDDVPEVLGKMS